jgi:glycosyltransferase involved in cell wall biosynthesis
MRICLVSTANTGAPEAARGSARLVKLLATRHEVTLVHADPGPDRTDPAVAPGVREVTAWVRPELEKEVFAGEDHRRSAAVLEAIESAYNSAGPDYVEVPDARAHGLVPLMARRCGHPLLDRTLFGVRLDGSAELVGLHDGTLGSIEARLLCELEREQLRLADRVVWPGGDVLDLYRRYYDFALPEASRVGVPFDADEGAPRPGRREPGADLRILYVAPLQRSAGALDLAEACLRLPLDDWRLTMVGDDTATAPGGQSVRLTIEMMFGDDPRLEIEEPEGGGGRPGKRYDLAKEHDLAVVPPRFAVWPEAALTAMRAGLPILASPVGGLAELVEPGRAAGAPPARLRRLADPEAILDGYERLLGASRPGPARRAQASGPTAEPLVTGVVPYFRTAPHVEEAVDSLLAQTHRQLEVLVVNDGSFDQEDEVLLRVAERPRVSVVTQLNSGETSARNLGVRLARGEYVALLDADNALEPQFVARALEVFDREPDLAYVSCWLRFVGPDGSPFPDPAGYAPVGNSVVRDDTNNWDGDTLALLPRAIFTELGYRFDPSAVIYSDWELYRWLREDDRYGTVIPERLARYKVLPSSLQRAHGMRMQRRGWDEARSRRALRAIRWMAEVGDG